MIRYVCVCVPVLCALFSVSLHLEAFGFLVISCFSDFCKQKHKLGEVNKLTEEITLGL